jgi:hypothetical protein
MRIYEVKRNGKVLGFARSFDQAKAIVKQDDYSARKVSSAGLDCLFSNNMNIHAVEIKPDKEGIISKLNSLIVQEPIKVMEGIDIKSHKPIVGPREPAVLEEEYVNSGDTGYVGIIPATEYKVDELNFPKKGKGRCLHCKKLVGYVGGFPAVNPPDAICD